MLASFLVTYIVVESIFSPAAIFEQEIPELDPDISSANWLGFLQTGVTSVAKGRAALKWRLD
jgi:hypothetical protein